MQNTGDAIVPTSGKELSAEALFGLELIKLNHQIGERGWITSQAMQIDPLERLTGVEIVGERARDIVGLRPRDERDPQSVHLNV